MSNAPVNRETVLEFHAGGKVGLRLAKPLKTQHDLCLAYTPGVAWAVKEIAARPDAVYAATAKRNLVAVVSDGTAILGLGDLGAAASIPVMEGKAVLFKAFGDVDAWPVPLGRCRLGGLDTGKTDPARVIDAVAALAPMYGGINLEDIAAPACFEIEDTLDAMLDIPVFHDDQWGTAVITLAGVMNYALLCGREMADLRVVVNGAGAAGIRIADMCKAAGVRDLTMCDTKGVIHDGRADLNGHKRRHAVKPGAAKTLADALAGAHVFIGVSVADCVGGGDVRRMAEYPAIFAMSNPDPEIHPAVVADALAGKPYIMATGRSDFPNQVNNVLGFPFLFRGALDVRARTINTPMKVAAATALAELARCPVTDDVQAVYAHERLTFGPGYIIPKPFDRRLFTEVSYAVAEAAVTSGAAPADTDLAALKATLTERNAMRVAN
ncbi:MAG: malate dehydrogenase [Kiritimatiellaeota bacterium]|nr:malate dehydrogenase [Kiritimatiellota bacterium]